jgi:putative SOS response-associated peptidase YedK
VPAFNISTLNPGYNLFACLYSEKLNFFKMFNARSETVASNPIFKRLLSNNRCVVAYDGFYEWLVDEHKEKQPYFVHYSDNRPMLMAALYDTAHNRETLSDADTAASSTDTAAASATPDSNDDVTRLYTYTVLTTNSSPRLEWLHDRMPVLLDVELAKQWLDPTVDASTLLPQLQPYNGDDLAWHPVTKAMNKVTYHGDDCTTAIELTADTPSKAGSKPITAFFSKQAKTPQKHSTTSSSSSSSSAVKATPTASKGKAKRATPTTNTAASPSSSSAKRAKTSSTSKASPVHAVSQSSTKHSAAATDTSSAAAVDSDADIQEAVARSLQQRYNKVGSSGDNTATSETQQHADDIEFERQVQQAIAASMGSSSGTGDTTTSTTAAAGYANSSSGSKRQTASAMNTKELDEQRVSKAVETGDDSSAPCTNSK